MSTTIELADGGTRTAAEPAGGGEIRCGDLVRIFATDGVEVQALQGLTLAVDPGEIVAVVGASGTDLLTMGHAERVRYQRSTVGFVWQQTSRNLLPYLTASENVRLPLELANTLPRRERRRRVEELLELLEVGHVAGRRPGEMSGGEQQRTAIAVAVSNNPRVLLADEPTGELDEATSVEVLEALRGVNRETGVTTLIVTHDPTVSEHVARTIQIRDGRTSTETLRRTETDEHGQARHVSEEFAVLDRVGRLQLPQDFVHALDLRDRVRLALEPDHVGVWPAAPSPGTEPGPGTGPNPGTEPGHPAETPTEEHR
jgi:putative ABC transport system ATP-binding protein